MQPTNFTCSRCGSPLMPGSTQCGNCGLTFAAPVPIAGPAPAYAPTAPAGKNPAAVVIVVIAVLLGLVFMIAVMAAILFPVFAKARDKAREISSRSNMKIIAVALVQYTQDYDGKMPPMNNAADFKAAVSSYVPNQKDGIDPFVETGANVPYQPNAALSCKPIADISSPETIVLLQETVPHSDRKVNILYADGTVETVMPGGDQSAPDTSQ